MSCKSKGETCWRPVFACWRRSHVLVGTSKPPIVVGSCQLSRQQHSSSLVNDASS